MTTGLPDRPPLSREELLRYPPKFGPGPFGGDLKRSPGDLIADGLDAAYVMKYRPKVLRNLGQPQLVLRGRQRVGVSLVIWHHMVALVAVRPDREHRILYLHYPFTTASLEAAFVDLLYWFEDLG